MRLEITAFDCLQDEREFEKCVVCGMQTDVPVSRLIIRRNTYYPACGQLCEKCCETLYHTTDLRTIPGLWDEFL